MFSPDESKTKTYLITTRYSIVLLVSLAQCKPKLITRMTVINDTLSLLELSKHVGKRKSADDGNG